jgi:hypothetical protein
VAASRPSNPLRGPGATKPWKPDRKIAKQFWRVFTQNVPPTSLSCLRLLLANFRFFAYVLVMITLQQTVDIPADRRLSIVLPETVPSGKTSVLLVFSAPENPSNENTKTPTIEELKAEAAAKYAATIQTGVDPARKFAGCLNGVFTEGGVEYQRRIRDEWPD